VDYILNGNELKMSSSFANTRCKSNFEIWRRHVSPFRLNVDFTANHPSAAFITYERLILCSSKRMGQVRSKAEESFIRGHQRRELWTGSASGFQ
jgi:hypothetical protein